MNDKKISRKARLKKEYYQANKEKLNKYRLAWHYRNKDKVKAYNEQGKKNKRNKVIDEVLEMIEKKKDKIKPIMKRPDVGGVHFTPFEMGERIAYQGITIELKELKNE